MKTNRYDLTRLAVLYFPDSTEKNARRRLLDMGFTPECRLFVVGTAPFGGTILVSLRGFTVALREDAADRIEVEAV